MTPRLSAAEIARALLHGSRSMTAWIALLLVASLVCYGIALHTDRVERRAAPTVVRRLPASGTLPAAARAVRQPRRIEARTASRRAPDRASNLTVSALLPSDTRVPRRPAAPRPERPVVAPLMPGARADAGLRMAGRAAGRVTVVDAGLRAAGPGMPGAGPWRSPSHAAVPARPAPPPTPAHNMMVWVTGYTLSGVTASGTIAGPGTCAVDPSFIPLGTHITVDSVGSCLAQDTGPEVLGAHVDVWVPSVGQAFALTGWHTARW